MSKQVLDIEQMKNLQTLGIDISKASVYWHNVAKFEKKKPATEWILSLNSSVPLMVKTIPAFTLQDILDLLPKQIVAGSSGYTYNLDINYEKNYIAYSYTDGNGYTWLNQSFRINDDLIEAAYKMFCWCIENEHIKRNI